MHSSAKPRLGARGEALRRIAGPVQVATAFIIGRKLRAEYASRVQAWRLLRALEVETRVLLVPPTVEDGGACLPTTGSLITSWASSPVGLSSTAHMQHCPVGENATVERIWREAHLYRIRRRSDIVGAVDALGILSKHGDVLSWGSGSVTLEAVVSCMQGGCQCVRVSAEAAALWICPVCRGFRIPRGASCALPLRGTCRWCSQICGTVCPACQRGVHFRGECSRFLHAADNRFRPGPGDARWLCPSCLPFLAQALRSGTLRPRACRAPLALDIRMRELADDVRLGGGSSVACPAAATIRPRDVRAIVLRTLSQGRWMSVAQIHRCCVAGGANRGEGLLGLATFYFLAYLGQGPPQNQ